MNERPVCHRAEDLVTYLYGEATADEARDFAAHLRQCDACRAEFTVFNQVHESIVTWRNDALGISTVPVTATVAQPITDSTPFVSHERKLSAWASVREFFSVSPLWLRGASAFAGLLLCVLLVFAVVRTGNQPPFDQKQFDQEVQRQVEEKLAALKRQTPEIQNTAPQVIDKLQEHQRAGAPVQVASSRPRSKRIKGLSPQEREQLAADLGLIPGREEEFPFVFPDEPNQ